MDVPAKTFKDLKVWRKSICLVTAVYKLVSDFPETELYGITSQLKRAAISIPTNIAEGFKKRTRSEKSRFMNIAQGSIEECRCLLIISQKLGFCAPSKEYALLEEVSKLLEGYLRGIRKRMNS